ncbi:IS5 family transposase [Streptomyces justiciae]|uniref:IS5 family transposase n=1 Tax=Streptomyces justiciae TaxID=2780140 RepID=UPI002243AF24|nr:IS5 family transposase [Streptomyces justiciae]MCW8379839.1 IS5 family transposase [Streptomyces justiciae]
MSDELWSLIEPLLPDALPKQVKGRPRVPDRQALCGMRFVPHAGIQWEYLPRELDFSSGMTCWRRLVAWNEAGVWDQLHQLLLKKLRTKTQLDWSRAVIDSSHVKAARRGPQAGPARLTAHARATNATSLPTARAFHSRCYLTGGNRNSVTQLMLLLQEIQAVAGVDGRPSKRPHMLSADRGYDHDKYRRLLRQRGIRPAFAQRGSPGTPQISVQLTPWMRPPSGRSPTHGAFVSLD